MSDFMEALVDLLPDHSALKDSSNELRKVLDKTVGAFCDDYDVLDFYDQLFLNSARGGYLDLFGRDYGVSRRLDEDDESYRERIIFEKLEYLTAHNLQNIYNVGLFNCFDGFNPVDNDLTSDNPYLSDWYVGVADEDTQDIVNKKFILDDSVVWYNGGELDYIIHKNGTNKILKQYREVYGVDSLFHYPFNNNIKSVKLTLPYVKSVNTGFKNLTYLTDIILDCPVAKGGNELFYGCTGLKNVKFNIPNLTGYTQMFKDCSALETIDVTIPTSIETNFKTYVLGLNLSHLTSFIINGEEVDLS